jgi:hypothetical protein
MRLEELRLKELRLKEQSRAAEPRNPQVVVLERFMQEWGIDKTSEDPAHKAFWNDNIEFLKEVVDGIMSEPANLPCLLPTNSVESMREVFDQELRNLVVKEKGMLDVTDFVKDRVKYLSMPAYKIYRYSNRYEMNEALIDLGIKPEELCPFKRFRFERVPGKELMRKQLGVGGGHMTYALRAIVAHGACHIAECVQCKSKDSLRWNGFDYSEIDCRLWKKLVCVNCGSVYEIKSAPSAKNINQKFYRGSDNGSFFDAFHAIQKELPAGAKQFVAVISAEKSIFEGRDVRAVHVAEVKGVVPLLKEKSFCRDGSRRIYSKMELARGPGRNWFETTKWFDAPCFEFDSKAIAMEVLDKL